MKFVPNAVTRTVARQILKTQKHSPKILFVAGVIGVGVTVVLACKATLKLEETLDVHDENLAGAKTLSETNPNYSKDDYNKDVVHLQVRKIVALGRLYGPAFSVGVLSIGCLAGAHHILSQRNAALTAAFVGLERAYGEYRDRVAAEFGKEKEEEIYYGMTPCEIVDEKGKKAVIKVPDPNQFSIYSKHFDETNPNWSRSPGDNLIFVTVQQNYLNDRLRAHGHVFLNEAYDRLGIPRTPAGAIVGWIHGVGDDFVDFGHFTRQDERATAFVNGQEKSILLDFNVAGVIYDKI